MANRSQWHLPAGPMNWFVFGCSVAFILVGAFLAFVAPIGSEDWWFGFGGFMAGALCALTTFWDPPEVRDRVTFDSEQIMRRLPNGKVEAVRWSDLRQVGIMTTSDGPAAEDVFFMLFGKGDSGCAVPQSAVGADELLARLQRLPGFDNEAVVRAMGSTSEDFFLCWKRPE